MNVWLKKVVLVYEGNKNIEIVERFVVSNSYVCVSSGFWELYTLY